MITLTVHNPNNLPVFDYRKIRPFQDALKDLTTESYRKITNSLTGRHGFFVPMFLWKDGDTMRMIDGHQRHRWLMKEDARPYELPYLLIGAANQKDAKEKLLLITGQYGKITLEGLQEFAFDIDDHWMRDNLAFDALPSLSLDITGLGPMSRPGADTSGIDGAKQQFSEEDRKKVETVAGYQTSMARTDISGPVRLYDKLRLLNGEVLDYGCGRDPHKYNRFDPYYYANYTLLLRQWNTVMCNFVLNILPLEHNRFELLRTLFTLIKPGGTILIAVRDDVPQEQETVKGYQCAWDREQWEAWLVSYLIEFERLSDKSYIWRLKTPVDT